ncbi:MAG: prefoldin subunit alpha [Candidatus Bathyarchaeia archaeon]
MSKQDEASQRLIIEYQILEGAIRVLQSRLDIVDAALNDLYAAHATLQGVKENSSGVEALIPMGAGSFVKATLTDTTRIIMGVGAGVCVEMGIDDSLLELKNRQSELEKARATLEEKIKENVAQLEQRRQALSDLVERRRTELPSGVREA